MQKSEALSFYRSFLGPSVPATNSFWGYKCKGDYVLTKFKSKKKLQSDLKKVMESGVNTVQVEAVLVLIDRYPEICSAPTQFAYQTAGETLACTSNGNVVKLYHDLSWGTTLQEKVWNKMKGLFRRNSNAGEPDKKVVPRLMVFDPDQQFSL